ncbi:MAG: hypothetical protein AUK58_04570 [Candidatus Moranbacteria bacterium CG2_30_41_165]|nr:MAG: hypothetical protein AUK58_04570 [Candidatus Moranbacteria bacterium CG2_30_41_165]
MINVMSFKISIHDDISIADLVDINKRGGVVLKTPHVGNIYPNNLAMAFLGIPMLFYDRTLGKKDFNFHPHKLIVDGKSEILADPNILTSHSVITHISKGFPYPHAVGTKLVDFHMSVLKRSLPQAHCFTYTEYVQKNKHEVLQILEAVTNLHPNLWTRIVYKTGITTKATARKWGDIVKLGIYGVTNLESGWIIPNPVSILFHGTIDTSKTNVNDAYLLSGPDMYRYINGYQEELNEIYDYLKRVLDWNLPEVMNCHIIPVVYMRFIVENYNKDALDELVVAYLKFISKEDLVRVVAKERLDNNDFKKLISEKSEAKQKILNCISENFTSFSKTVFYDIEDANCFTQYDLLKGGGLYIHPWAIDNKLNDVSKAFIFLRKCYSLVRDQLQEEI